MGILNFSVIIHKMGNLNLNFKILLVNVKMGIFNFRAIAYEIGILSLSLSF